MQLEGVAGEGVRMNAVAVLAAFVTFCLSCLFAALAVSYSFKETLVCK